MVKGKLSNKLLTKENILSKISQYDIIRAFYPSNQEIKLNRATNSPFRKDDNPSFILGTKYGYGVISYKDLGDYNYRGDVWKFVQQIEGLSSFEDVLKIVDKRFGLGLGSGNINKTPIVITWKQPKEVIITPPKFHLISRKPNKEELAYWNSYYQDISDLKRENIYFIKTLYRNRKKLPSSNLLEFAYYYPDIDQYKIYRPFGKSGKKIPPEFRKWDSSLPFDYIENLSGIKGCKFGYLNKSKKDRMVLMKALEVDCICSVQAEDAACLSEESLDYIKNNSEIQVIISDNDKKGKQFSWWLTKEHNYKHVNVPDKYLTEGISDFADYGRLYSLETVRNHFKNKNLI